MEERGKTRKQFMLLIGLIAMSIVLGKWVSLIEDKKGKIFQEPQVRNIQEESAGPGLDFFEAGVKKTGIIGLANRLRQTFIKRAGEDIITHYKEEYGDRWGSKLKEDFGDQAEGYYKAKYGKEYKEKIKKEIVTEYKKRHGPAYKEKISEDYKDEAVGYYKEKYKDEWETKLEEDIVGQYKADYGDEYKEKIIEDLKEDYEKYKAPN